MKWSILICLSLLAGCGEVPKNESLQSGASGGGELVYQTRCLACHGASGEGNPALKSPSIAGLPHWYVNRQLAHYRDGLRGYAPGDVLGKQMQALTELLAEEDIEAVSDFVAGLPAHPTTNTLGGDVAAGRKVFRQDCARCHRYNGSGEQVFGSPPLIVLPDVYLKDQIAHFAAGTRGAKEGDIHGQKMGLIAKQHLKEKDVLDVLAYIAELAQNPPTGESQVDEESLPEVPDF